MLFFFSLTPEHPRLESIIDPIIFNVYDEIVTNFKTNEEQDNLQNVQFIEKKLLGTTEVLLSTVFLNTKVINICFYKQYCIKLML